jgi:2-iminoacetate synthase ThiH
MIARGDRTLLLAQWIGDITEVTVDEVLLFAEYAQWPVREVMRRLAEAGVKILPEEVVEPVEERMLEALRRGDAA